MYFYSHSLKVTVCYYYQTKAAECERPAGELLYSLIVDGSTLRTQKWFCFVNKHLAAALLPVYYNSCCATPVMFVLILSAAEAV